MGYRTVPNVRMPSGFCIGRRAGGPPRPCSWVRKPPSCSPSPAYAFMGYSPPAAKPHTDIFSSSGFGLRTLYQLCRVFKGLLFRGPGSLMSDERIFCSPARSTTNKALEGEGCGSSFCALHFPRNRRGEVFNICVIHLLFGFELEVIMIGNSLLNT